MTVVEAASRKPAVLSIRLDRGQVVLCGIVLIQAVWLWILIARGWYLQTDFSNLADGLGHPLTWSYLREPIGGHFGPGGRVLFWLLTKLGTLNFTLTIVFRVVAQAISTILLYRVLRLLVGRSNLVLTVVGLYAFSPLLLAGLAWMTSGLALVLGQACALLAIEMHLHYGRTNRMRFAVAAGLLLMLATFIGDLWIIAVLTLPILSAGYIYQGSIRRRFIAFLVHWRAWTVTLLPVMGAAALILALANTASAHNLALPAAYRLVRNEWLRAVGPAFVGGPWSWFADSQTYVAFLAPPDEALLLGQIVFVVLVLIGFQRNGWRSLAGWAIPVVTATASVLLIGIGRFQASGLLIAITPRYSFQIMAPLAIGVVLALSRPSQPTDAVAGSAPDGADAEAVGVTGLERVHAVFAVGAAVVVTALSVWSDLHFTHYWAANPAKSYVAALTASARAAGPDVNIYDTPVPGNIISVVEPHHHVSDLLHLAGVPAKFDASTSEPLVADDHGNLVKAVFLTAANAAPPPLPNCGTPIRGAGLWTLSLSKPVSIQEWFLRIDLYQAEPSVISIEVLNADGRVIVPPGGDHVHLSTLEVLNMRLPFFSPAAVRIHSESPSTNLCLVHIRIGGPLAVPRTVK